MRNKNGESAQNLAAKIRIGERRIGPGEAPFVVAEAGINHNGEIAKALAMIETAKAAGADAVKFQTFTASEFIADETLTFTYRSQGKSVTESMLKMFERCELAPAEWRQIKAKCDDCGILFLSTPQNVTDLELILDIGVPAVKVGSDDFSNLPLLRAYAKTGLPLILSCGMSDLGETHRALETVGWSNGYPTVLLVCTSQYPTPPEDANLLRIKTLQNAFPGLTVGFSDHTQGFIAAAAAIGLGATVFEKHFTLNKNLPGPDHWFSEDPQGLKDWVGAIRAAETFLGDPLVRPTQTEVANKKDFQRLIVAALPIKAGEIFTADNLTMRRVSGGQGLAPALYDLILGKRAQREFKKGDAIQI